MNRIPTLRCVGLLGAGALLLMAGSCTEPSDEERDRETVVRFLLERALDYQREKKFDAACADYRQVLRLDPQNVQAKWGLAASLTDLGNEYYENAKHLLLSAGPGEDESRRALENVEALVKKAKDAHVASESWYRALLAGTEDNELKKICHYGLGRLFYFRLAMEWGPYTFQPLDTRDDDKDGIPNFKDPDSKHYYLRHEEMEKCIRAERDLAIENLEEAIRLGLMEKDCEAQRWLAVLLIARNQGSDLARARELLEDYARKLERMKETAGKLPNAEARKFYLEMVEREIKLTNQELANLKKGG